MEPSPPAQLDEPDWAIDMAIAQTEHQFVRTGWILDGGKELVNAARSEMASPKPGDERGQFVEVEGENIRASERKPRKKAEPGADQPSGRRRWRKF